MSFVFVYYFGFDVINVLEFLYDYGVSYNSIVLVNILLVVKLGVSGLFFFVIVDIWFIE